MHNYKLISKKGFGTFSEVFKVQSLKTGNFLAIKCMKQHFKSIEQVQRLREIQALKKVSNHQNIIKLIEVLFDEPTGRLALVFELMDQNLYEAIKGRKTYLNQQKVKFIMYQLMKAIDHIHKKGIFHRDIKPENILLIQDKVQLADFGSCKGMYSQNPYTEYISTRWYRAPECLLTDGYYDYKMDIWGAGCIMFEILALFPLFPGDNELDQVHKIHKILGTPKQAILDRFQEKATHMEFNFPYEPGTDIHKLIPFVPAVTVDLIKQLLIYDPLKRITAQQALQHPYFKDIHDVEFNSHIYDRINLSHSLSPQKYASPNSKDAHTVTLRADQTLGKGLDQKKKLKKNNIMQQSFGSTSINKFNQTQKYKPYKEQGENVFYPVLSIKKAKKKKKIFQGQKTQYNDIKVNNLKDSGTEDEQFQQGSGFLPPIKYQQSMGTFSDVNKMGNTLTKQRDNSNPFKVNKKKVQHLHSSSTNSMHNNTDYLILGKKASYL